MTDPIVELHVAGRMAAWHPADLRAVYTDGGRLALVRGLEPHDELVCGSDRLPLDKQVFALAWWALCSEAHAIERERRQTQAPTYRQDGVR